MGFLIVFILIGMIWAYSLVKEGYSSFFEWLGLTAISCVGTFIVVFMIGFVMATTTQRDVASDKISIVGDSYIIENGNKTESVKSDKFPLEIGKKDFVTYSRITSKKNWYNDFFGFTDECKTKSMSDSEFINGASIVKIGINKENIK